jgi:HEAT repeat protein
MFLAPILLAFGQVAAGSNPQGSSGGVPAPLVQDATSPLMRGVVSGLQRARDPKAPERPELAKQIAKLGPPAIPVLAEILESGRLPSADSERPLRTNIYQEEILLKALECLGSRASLRQLEARMASSGAEPARVALLKGYGALGTYENVARILELGAGSSVEVDESDGPARAALASLLQRDPLGVPRLSMLWRRCPPALVSQVLFALGDARDGRALKLAANALEIKPEFLPLVAAQIQRIGRSPQAEVNIDLAEDLRRELDGKAPQLQATILQALAALEDPLALPSFVEGLGSSEIGVRAAALWSLERVSALRLGSSPEGWERWLRAETEWFDKEYPRLLTELKAYEPSRTAAAIRDLAPHRAHRNEIAVEIATVLQHPKPSLRALACRALGELGSVDALPSLVPLLHDDDPEVVTAAREALCKITHRTYESTSPEWEALVADRSL